MMTQHLISVLVLLPALAAIIVLFMPRQSVGAIRNFALLAMLVEFVVSGFGLFGLEGADFSTAGYRFVEQHAWIPSLGIQYKVGIDGISLWLVMLTTLLTPIALYASWSSIDTKIKEYAFSFLLLQSAMVGAFVALDLFLFYVFWELMLIPMYLIVGIWGGKQRIYAAVKFFIYTMAGSLVMLVAIIYVAIQYKELAGAYSFDLTELTRLALPFGTQVWLFLAFALAFAIKVPMFPFHTWLPDAHVQAPTGGSVILAAVLLKLGGYGFIRFAMPLFPLAAYELAPMPIAGLAIVGIIYGALCAWVQRDVKKLVAYSSVSHLGFVVLGIFSATQQGVSGAVLQMVSHGISTGALFILVGVIYNRRHTRDLDAFGGLAKVMPIYATLFVITAMSSVGLPGTNGFVGEFMILFGTFASNMSVEPGPEIFAALAATGVVLAAIYMLHAVLKMFWGPVTHEENKNLPDLNRQELAVLLPLMVLIFVIGLFPNLLLKPMEASVNGFIRDYHGRVAQMHQDDSKRLLSPPVSAHRLPAEDAAYKRPIRSAHVQSSKQKGLATEATSLEIAMARTELVHMRHSRVLPLEANK